MVEVSLWRELSNKRWHYVRWDLLTDRTAQRNGHLFTQEELADEQEEEATRNPD